MLFLFNPCCFNSSFTILLVIENAKLTLAFAIPIGAPIIVAKEAIDIPSLVADEIIKDLSK